MGKKWRNEKYSKKIKVDQWQDKRKKYIQSKYFRMLQKEGKVNNPNMAPLGEKNVQKSDSDRSAAKELKDKDESKSQKKKKSYSQTKQEFERRKKQAENRQKEEDRKQKFIERKEALEQYKAKKSEKFKVLSRKTSKGQPLMSGRIEMLLEKIKASE